MKLIKTIRISYLRSIHRLRVTPVGDLTVFSGANDVGKSNLLKALNLFFNNEIDWKTELDFYQDFSLRRLDEVRRESIKGKQFIRIDIEFLRPSNYKGSLPPTFTVTKTWLRNSRVPEEKNDLEKQFGLGKLPSSLNTARRMLSQFLNRIRFEYVPAIRDKRFFDYVLDNLQETLIATQMEIDDPILLAVKDLNANLQEKAKSLRDDFKKATDIKADVSLPVDPSGLFRAFSVSTTWNNQRIEDVNEQEFIALALRGDGIQARYIPSLLNYIATNSSLFYIWGFEEPENSVEYNLAIELAHQFNTIYTQNAQIFITSHSPAFISLEGSQIISYRVYKDGNTTTIAPLYPKTDEAVLEQLADDIGLFRIQEQLYKQYLEQRNNLLKARQKVEKLAQILENSRMPVVYVEGKTDVKILKTAWSKLFTLNMPFEIKSSDPLPHNNSGGSGGADILATFLKAVRADSPHIAIGIFDRDKEGIDCYTKKFPKYFNENQNLEAKVSENQKSVAFLLPVPPEKQPYADCFNFYIEFYFSDTALEYRTEEGQGLEFSQPTIEKRIQTHGHPLLNERTSTLPHTRQINSGKKVFAEQIVPILAPTEFEPFRLIFDKIQDILDFLKE